MQETNEDIMVGKKKFGCFILRSRLNIRSLIFLRLKFLSSPAVIYYCCCFYYSKDASIKKSQFGHFVVNVFGGTIETLFLVLDHLSVHIEAL